MCFPRLPSFAQDFVPEHRSTGRPHAGLRASSIAPKRSPARAARSLLVTGRAGSSMNDSHAQACRRMRARTPSPASPTPG